MLDINMEQIISLNEAASRLPRRRGGKKPHVATLYRWAQNGCRGIFLETCQVGGTRCTSVEALQRFVDRLSGGDRRERRGGPENDSPIPPSCRRRAEDVERELQDEGL